MAKKKPDDAKVEDSKVEDSKAEEARADDAKADDANADEAKTDDAKADAAKTEDAKADAAKTEDADAAKADEAKADDAKTEEPKSADEEKAPSEDGGSADEIAAAARKAGDRAIAAGPTPEAEREADEPIASGPKPAPKPKGKRWGEPIARFEAAWTRFETRLIWWVLVAQLLSMVSWVLLSGLSSPLQSGNASGFVMRAVLGAIVLGLGGWMATRKQSLNTRRLVALGGIVVGVALAKAWRSSGVEYFDNVKAWLQEGSTLTLMGGLRGLATRLTLWLALLGASLATAAGKHINIDVIFRFVPKRYRIVAAIVNYSAAALVCLSAVWGFFDHIAIESFNANADDTAGTKINKSIDRIGEHFFLTRKQLSLDIKTLPHIVKGDRFDRWMSAGEWNDWVKGAGFEGHYPPETVESVLVPPDAPPHTPLVVAPDGESTRSILVHDLSLVFPFGMLVLALRFLLRILLTLSGHIEVDPDAAHKEEIGHHTTPSEPEKGGA